MESSINRRFNMVHAKVLLQGPRRLWVKPPSHLPFIAKHHTAGNAAPISDNIEEKAAKLGEIVVTFYQVQGIREHDPANSSSHKLTAQN